MLMGNNEERHKPCSMANVKLKNGNETPARENS